MKNQKKFEVKVANRFTKAFWASLGFIAGIICTLIYLNFIPRADRDSFTGVWDKTVYAVKIAFTSKGDKVIEVQEAEASDASDHSPDAVEDVSQSDVSDYYGPSDGLLAPTEEDPFVGEAGGNFNKQLLKELIKTGEIKKRLTKKQLANLICAEYDGENLRGDLHLGEARAYGVLQIRRPYVSDVNEMFGTSIKASDCEHDVELSVLVVHAYMQRYVERGILPKNPPFREMALLHTSGPTGYKNNAKLWYWDRVKGKSEKQIAQMLSQFGKDLS